jgi:hypothetical protein
MGVDCQRTFVHAAAKKKQRGPIPSVVCPKNASIAIETPTADAKI